MNDPLHSIPDAAKLLGNISVNTVGAWLSSGVLRRVKIGSRTMIRESELLRLIEAGDGGKSKGPKAIAKAKQSASPSASAPKPITRTRKSGPMRSSRATSQD